MTMRQARSRKANTPVRATCPDCGKIRYQSRRDARRYAAKIHQDARARAYQCGGFWHLTSTDAKETTARRRTA